MTNGKKCASAAIAKRVKELKEEYPDDPVMWSLGSGGGIDIAISACGYAKPPKEIPPDILKLLRDFCKNDARDWKVNIIQSQIFQYGEKFEQEIIVKECQKIAEAPPAKAGFRIARVYSPAQGYTNAVIETDRERRVKCAAKLHDEFQAVEEATITPPVDEIIFGVAADSVTCWPK